MAILYQKTKYSFGGLHEGLDFCATGKKLAEVGCCVVVVMGILTTNNWAPNLWAVLCVGNPNPAAVMLPCPMSG